MSSEKELVKKIKPKKFDKMKKAIPGKRKLLAVVKLYVGEEGTWKFVTTGCLFVVELKKKKVLMFHLVDFLTNKIVWQHELFQNIQFVILTNYFLSFEGAKHVFGLSFAEECDARGFYKKAIDLLVKTYRKKDKKKHRFFTGLKKIFGKKRKPKVVHKVVISQPKQFTHGFHIGPLSFDAQWEDFLKKKLDLKPEEFNDPKKSQQLLEVLMEFENQQVSYPTTGKKKNTSDDAQVDGDEEANDEASDSDDEAPDIDELDLKVKPNKKKPKITPKKGNRRFSVKLPKKKDQLKSLADLIKERLKIIRDDLEGDSELKGDADWSDDDEDDDELVLELERKYVNQQ